MLALFFVAILSTALAVPPIERIVGGDPTTIEQHPFMANVRFWDSPRCGGTLINNRSVLSAAHCISLPYAFLYDVVLGATPRSGAGGSVYPVSQIIMHPEYNPSTIDNDVLLLRLSSSVIYSNSIAPARIGNFALPHGAPLKAVGWGRLSYGGPVPTTLQEVTVDYIDTNICSQRYQQVNIQLEEEEADYRYPPVTSNMLCAGILDVGGRDACQGDSGGPIVYDNDIIMGITSWGHECARASAPGVYARVSRYSSWISLNA